MARILIVEDNEMNRDMLSRRLERKGYQVITATDGSHGIAAARAESPDLILMDMSLPEIDGWEATRRLKSDECDPTHSRHRADRSRDVERPSEGCSRRAATTTTRSRSSSRVCWRRYRPCSEPEEMKQ